MADPTSASWMSIDDFLQNADPDAIKCFQKAKWDRLCDAASEANNGLECVPLDKMACGLNNVVRLVRFSNGTCWVARLHINTLKHPKGYRAKARLQSEVATMQFINERSHLPIPQVFAFALDEENPVAVPYILMEALSGVVAMDANGGYKVHCGKTPTKYRSVFYNSVALCHVQLTSIRLPKIGAVFRTPDGTFDVGPLPGIGGPFNTSAEFFEAWANTVQFKWDRETIRSMMLRAPIPADEMITIIDQFPSQIKALAGRLSSCNHGPFPLCHNDFLHSNIMVDENTFKVTGIIDWEGACAVPWELIAFPDFLKAMPRAFDLPHKYGADGEPLEEEMRERWRERKEYVEMVKSVEKDEDDHLLSAHLGSDQSQALAYCYGAFTSIGKLGFYNKVVEEIEKIMKVQ